MRRKKASTKKRADGFMHAEQKSQTNSKKSKKDAMQGSAEGAPTGIDPFVYLSLKCREREYAETKNGIVLEEACLIARRAGLNFPSWAQYAIAKAFEESYKAYGKGSLNKLLSISPDSYNKRARKERNGNACLNVFKLRVLFGVNAEQACAMEAARLRAAPMETEQWGEIRRRPSESTIRAAYWSKTSPYPRWEKCLQTDEFSDVRRALDSVEKREFLATFPPDEIPLELKSYLT